MKSYFKEKEVDFDPQLLDLQIETEDQKKNSQFIEVEDEDNISIIVPLNRQRTSASSMKEQKKNNDLETKE